MKDFKKLRSIFSDDPNILQQLNAEEQNELLKELVKDKVAADSETKQTKIEFLKGEKGLKGDKGDKGDSIIGPKGDKGDSGKNGKDGIDAIGIPGIPGKDGSSDTPNQIADKLNTLEEVLKPKVIIGYEDADAVIKKIKKQKLEMADIRNMPLNMNDLRWHGSGALQPTDSINVKNITAENIGITQEQVSGNIRPGYHGFFNGGPSGSNYSIGQAYSIDGVYWQADLANPFLIPVVATWEANVVKDPWVVIVDNIYYLYYAGWRSSTNRFQIGLAISKDYGQTYVKYSGNPIIANGGVGTVDERRAIFPTVLYDSDETNPAKKWKMWYGGRNSLDLENIAYAYSADGITWTKFGQVLALGSAGQFDDTVLQPNDVKKINGTYYLFYGAATVVTGRNQFSEGLATFTNPEGTYTKQGQILTSLPTRIQNLTADTLLGSKIVTVADTSVFEANEYVLIADSDTAPLLTRINSIDSATQVTLRDAVTGNITTGNSGAIRSVFSWSAAGRSIFRENGHWTMAVTFYQVFSDMGYLNELSGWAYNYNAVPTGNWTIDIKRGLALETIAGTWDSNSAENFSIIPLRSSPYQPKNTGGVINLIIDGAGSAITTGVKLDVYLPIAITLTEATLLADQSGSIVLDLWVDTYGNYPPTITDTITASAKPTLSTAVKSQDTTLTGWTTAIAAGKSMRVNVDSATTVTRVVLALKFIYK
jgi:predicted GH43/DUF377 family glycosyl hydrolase